jgi:hypothetical protein
VTIALLLVVVAPLEFWASQWNRELIMLFIDRTQLTMESVRNPADADEEKVFALSVVFLVPEPDAGRTIRSDEQFLFLSLEQGMMTAMVEIVFVQLDQGTFLAEVDHVYFSSSKRSQAFVSFPRERKMISSSCFTGAARVQVFPCVSLPTTIS